MEQNLNSNPIEGKTPTELVNVLFRDWLSRTSRVLVDNVGSKMALEMVKPYSLHAGMAMVLNIKNETGAGDGYQTPGYAGHFGCTCIGINLRTEIRESGTYSIASSCGIANPIPELCVNHVVQMFTGFCDITAPDYEPILLSSLAKQDRVCEWVVKHKDVPVEQVMNEKVIAECLPPPLTKEIQSLWEFSYYSEWWMLWLKALIEYMGAEEAVASVKEGIQESASSFLENAMVDVGSSTADTHRIATVLNLIDEGMHREGIMEELSPGLSAKRITACPFNDAPEAICHLHEIFNKSICRALDPLAEFAYDRMMTNGDKTCHWTIRKKGEPSKEKSKEEASDDPAKMLAIRLVKGEISEEEFDRKMALLKKHSIVK